MRHFAAITFALLLTAAGHARAQGDDNTVVVELFTSQGCASCPPADRLLGEMAMMDHVIPLALHVDYWDYIGWKDQFATPAFSERQRAYARAAGKRMVYTPQMIIGGRDSVVGTQFGKLSRLIQSHSARPRSVDLSVSRQGQTLTINARALTAMPRDMVVQLVRYRKTATVDILRGENAGKTLTYYNIVNSWNVLRQWDGQAPLQVTTTLEGEQPFAVLIQQAGYGPILAASASAR